MATFKGDIRYQARCKRCQTPIGDWAMKVPDEDKLCWNCRHHDLKDIPYKKGGNYEI